LEIESGARRALARETAGVARVPFLSLHTAPNEEIVKLLPKEFYGGDKDIFDKVLTANKGIYTADGRTTAREQQNAYQQVLDTGRLKASQPIDLKKIFVTEFLDKANGK
jgi:NitT/TauT family transport system substrate-binding protein